MSETGRAPSLLPRVHFEVMTLFPEFFDSVLTTSLLGKAIEAGLIAVDRTNPRPFGVGRHQSLDDAPYGGGPGMILRPEPLAAAIDDVETQRGRAYRLLLSPQGRLFDQPLARSLTQQPRVMLICGRYEGIDERIATLYADDVVSIGDYVLSGGEVGAAVIIEAVSRLIPGVLGSQESLLTESHDAGRLEFPQWTRPPDFRGHKVPDILLSGDHAAIAAWRRLQALDRTQARRPELLHSHPVTEEERKIQARAAKAGGDAAPGRGPSV